MHQENRMWWEYCAKKYPTYFNNAKVIELGSYDINGSIRDYFKNCEYVGVDWRAGPGVDLVSLVHNLSTDKKYDSVVSASMLEHDPYPIESLKKMVELMTPDSILILTWGCGHAIGEHCLCEAPDGKYHALKGQIVKDFLVDAGLHIAEFRYIHTFLGYKTNKEACLGRRSWFIGELLAIAFKNPDKIVGERVIDDMLPDDCGVYKVEVEDKSDMSKFYNAY